ncbi:MAG: DNA-binding protein [Chloroflexi bacterium]|nr:DNA-binding protein [Chloroflexota bacterium]
MAKGMTKSDFVAAVAEKAQVSKKEVTAVLDALMDVAVGELKNGNEVTLPGMAKLKAVHKPPVPEREGLDPFTKQPKIFKAKPASTAVKMRPVKALKDAVM